jgi:hypothetical protein
VSERAAEDLAQQMREQLREAQEAHARYLSELEETAADSRARRPKARGGGAEDQRAAASEEGTTTPEQDPAMTVLADVTLPTASRVAVLRRLAASLSRRPEYIEALLRIVRDRDDASAVRVEALRVLGSAAFQVARFTPYRQDYEDALHDLIDDPVPALRAQAVSILAQEHDPVVQEALLAGLRGGRPLPVDREEAILLLAEDDHLDNLPWLRELYQSGSPDAREQAVRFMGSYPQARTTLEEILRDKSEASGVRQQSAASLRSLDPDRFEHVAKEVATDATDYPEIRVASLTALQHLGNPDRVRADSAFTSRVRELRADASAPEVAEVAGDFLEQEPGT